MACTVSIGAFILLAIVASIIVGGFIVHMPSPAGHEKTRAMSPESRVSLPPPKMSGTVSVEEAVLNRRSIREYAKTALEISEISQLLWAAQGVTDPSGLHAAPSAGALYPLEIYVVCGNVNGLEGGVYHYIPKSHTLDRFIERDVRENLYKSALQQPSIRDAAAVIIIAAEFNRTTWKYGERGIRYVHMEAGHVSENIYLQAYALGIGTVAIGAFDDGGVQSVLELPSDQTPLYLMPIGKMMAQDS